MVCTQTFAEDQIEGTREHAYTKNFRRHGGSHFQRNCDLTDCHPFFVCLPLSLITIPLLPSSLKLPSQKPRIAFHVAGASFPCTAIFLRPWAPLSASGLLPYYVPCLCVSRSCRCSRSVWQLLSSTMSARFFEFSQLHLCTLFLGQILHDPFARRITVSTQLHCKSPFARVRSDVFGTQIPVCLLLKPLLFIFLFLFFCVSVGSFILFRM